MHSMVGGDDYYEDKQSRQRGEEFPEQGTVLCQEKASNKLTVRT